MNALSLCIALKEPEQREKNAPGMNIFPDEFFEPTVRVANSERKNLILLNYYTFNRILIITKNQLFVLIPINFH